MAGEVRAAGKKETTAALLRKQQARQQAGLARLYQRELGLKKAVTDQQQESAQQAEVLIQLNDEIAALNKLYRPIRGRAGKLILLQAAPCLLLLLRQNPICNYNVDFCFVDAADQKRRLDAAMRNSHAVHVLREISHQQKSDIDLLKQEIARLLERSKASFAHHRLLQPDIIYSS